MNRYELIALDKGALVLRAPPATDSGQLVGPVSLPGNTVYQYLTGASQALSTNPPPTVAVGDLVSVSAYSATSAKCPATWKCTSVNSALPSGAVAGNINGNAKGALYVANQVGTYYKYEIAGDVNVQAFGATADGVTDDTPAFNAATAYVRDTYEGVYYYYGLSIVIPPGFYSISSWNLTNLLIQNLHIIAYGATLIASTAGLNVVDALSSRYIKFHGLMVYSGPDVVARSAVQIGVRGTETIGNFAFNDVTLIGYYSLAPYLNLGSETTAHVNVRLIQRNTDEATYAMIADSLALYLPTSLYVTITRVAGVGVSFTANDFVGCQIRNEGGGSAAYVSASIGWNFDEACYWLTFNQSAIIIYGTTVYRTLALNLRGSFESNQTNVPTPGNTGAKYAVSFGNDGTNTAIQGFTFHSSALHYSVAAFRNYGAGSYRISGADIKIPFPSPLLPLFLASGAISIDGSIDVGDARSANFAELSSVNGIVMLDTYANLASKPTAGTYTIYSRSNSKAYTAGEYLPVNNPLSFTPTVTFATVGDLSVSYATRSGRYTPLAGGAAFIEVYLTFTPTFTTASGEFRISGLPLATNSSATAAFCLPVSIMNPAFTYPAGVTFVAAILPEGSTNVRLYGSGSGISSTVFTQAHVPSGSAKTIAFSGVYFPPAQ